MHRGFMAAEEYGRLNDHPRRKILTEIYEDMAGGYFRFEEIDQEQVVRHTLPSEIFAELDARKAARLRVSAAVAIATVVEPQLYRGFSLGDDIAVGGRRMSVRGCWARSAAGRRS
ncbi:hypothetical protein FIBSPDRAFT_887935 [Athelia psychrophila]|uniref:Uncharacterized protein n=1 Tax=Athelia psychrophila TaxID=1759441 RepID=A0A166P3Z2_9AGAM|nr:hypothetical protein FIBSPDRAFT_887935 [Fibularhizoctonia sp. CBS 109695]